MKQAIKDMIDEVTASGSHFFSRENMRFSASKIHDVAIPTSEGLIFVTSEKTNFGPEVARRFTVRIYRGKDEGVDRLSDFLEHGTLRAARAAAAKHAVRIGAK